VPESPQQERLNQDLGLGGTLYERSHARLLNRDGSFNIRRNSLGPFHPYNVYHTLVSLPVPRVFLLMVAGYFATDLLFATLSWLAGADPEVVCLITADDETFAQTVHARCSHDKADTVWGARFRDMYLPEADRVTIDLGRLNDFAAAPPPSSL
jgi:hypothetical protein